MNPIEPDPLNPAFPPIPGHPNAVPPKQPPPPPPQDGGGGVTDVADLGGAAVDGISAGADIVSGAADVVSGAADAAGGLLEGAGGCLEGCGGCSLAVLVALLTTGAAAAKWFG